LLVAFRCGRHRLFNSAAYACTQRHMQLASTASPRSANNSATCSQGSGYRKYQRTAVRITSPEYWRPLNGLPALIDMPYRTKSAHSNFAMEPCCVVVRCKLQGQAIHVSQMEGFGDLLFIATSLIPAAHAFSVYSPGPRFHNRYAISTPENLRRRLATRRISGMIQLNGREIFQKRRADKGC
jgi:hypothetical protein